MSLCRALICLSHHHSISTVKSHFTDEKDSTLGCFCVCTAGGIGKALFCGFNSKQSDSSLWVLTILPHCLPNSIQREARYISGPRNAYNLRQGVGEQTPSVKGQMVNILSSVDRAVCVTETQPWQCINQ